MRTGGKCDALARARAEVRGGPMFLDMGSSFYEIWVSNSVVITEFWNFFFFGHQSRDQTPCQIRELTTELRRSGPNARLEVCLVTTIFDI